MNAIFKNTPMDIVKQILDYSGAIKYRNGKFMGRIEKEDERYTILETVSPIKTKLFNGNPWRYIRDLGKFYTYLFIDTAYDEPRYKYIFSKKREKNDTSSIILYYYRIK